MSSLYATRLTDYAGDTDSVVDLPGHVATAGDSQGPTENLVYNIVRICVLEIREKLDSTCFLGLEMPQ